MKTKRICPVCGQEYTDPPAISRRDNDLMICPACGTREALEDYLKAGTEEHSGKDTDIIDAMHTLGYHNAVISLKRIDADRAVVFLNDERFGIYDFVKHTFVD